MSEEISRRDKLTIYVMDRDSSHLQAIKKSFKKLKLKSYLTLKTFQSAETVLASVKKVLDNLILPPPEVISDSSVYSFESGEEAEEKKNKPGSLHPISLILFELETGTTDGWIVHEKIKQMYAEKRD